MMTKADPDPLDGAAQELERLYRDDVLRELIKGVRKDWRLSAPDFCVTKCSRVCGSEITIEGTVTEEGVVDRIGYRTRACSLGMASTGLLARRAPGATLEEIQEAGEVLRRVLSGQDGSAIATLWPELQCFSAAKHLTVRHSSIMLGFDALIEGLRTVR